MDGQASDLGFDHSPLSEIVTAASAPRWYLIPKISVVDIPAIVITLKLSVCSENENPSQCLWGGSDGARDDNSTRRVADRSS